MRQKRGKKPSPKPLRVARVFQEKLTQPPGVLLPSDSQIETTCVVCGLAQNLYQCSIEVEDNSDTLYHCHGCGDLLIVVCNWPSTKWTGRGYRIDDYCIHNKIDLYAHLRGATAPLLFPGHPDACTPAPDQALPE